MNKNIIIRTLLVFVVVVSSLTLRAQGVMTGDAIKNIQFTDANGRLLSAGQSGIEGTPYVFEKFSKGKVIFTNGVEATDPNLNYSYFDHKLYFTKDNNLYTVNLPVKDFYLENAEDPNNIITKHFACGFPVVESNTLTSYYEVLGQGKVFQLLKYSHKRIKESNVYGGAPVKEYVMDNTYFVYEVSDKKMLPVGSSISFKNLKKVLPNDATKLDELAAATKINTKNEEGLGQLIEKFN
jgi:hypothetical protein